MREYYFTIRCVSIYKQCIQGNPKLIKFVPFNTGFCPRFYGYFELELNNDFKYFIYGHRVSKQGTKWRGCPFTHKYILILHFTLIVLHIFVSFSTILLSGIYEIFIGKK